MAKLCRSVCGLTRLRMPGSVGRFAHGPVQLPGRDRVGVAAPREQPAVRQQDAASLALAPPEPQQLEQLRRQHGIAVLAAFALFDADQHPLAVDVVGLEVRDLRHAQPRAVRHAERSPVLDPRRRLEQLRHLVDAQDIGQLARTMRQHQAARQIGALQRHAEQEAQRRYRSVDRAFTDTALALVKLEAPHVLGGRGVGRPGKEAREGADVTDIVVLRARAHAAHRHVVEHALTKRGNGSVDR